MEEYTRLAGQDALKAHKFAWEKTMSVVEEILSVEKEIDERVKALYEV